MSNLFVDYSLDYKEACFYAWYRAGKPSLNGIIRVLPATSDGRKPAMETVRKWMRGGDGWISWHQHADELDAEASKILDKEAVEERIKLVKQLAEDNKLLKEKGLEAIKGENPFKDDLPAAVRAIIAGGEGEFKYSGMATSLLAVAQMTDKQLDKEMRRLLGQNENEIVDVEATEIDETIDGDSDPEDDNS